MDEYSEPAWVTALVEAGELPPVEERLPVKPYVVDFDTDEKEIGKYGGSIRLLMAKAKEGEGDAIDAKEKKEQ